MLRRPIMALAVGSLMLLAACGSGASKSAPASAAAGTPASAAAGICSQTTDAGAVTVSIKGFAFNPGQVSAKVDQIITFTNDDSAPHTATLVDAACSTKEIAAGKADGLRFSKAGTYPFRCDIHKTMTGTITITQ